MRFSQWLATRVAGIGPFDNLVMTIRAREKHRQPCHLRKEAHGAKRSSASRRTSVCQPGQGGQLVFSAESLQRPDADFLEIHDVARIVVLQPEVTDLGAPRL